MGLQIKWLRRKRFQSYTRLNFFPLTLGFFPHVTRKPLSYYASHKHKTKDCSIRFSAAVTTEAAQASLQHEKRTEDIADFPKAGNKKA